MIGRKTGWMKKAQGQRTEEQVNKSEMLINKLKQELKMSWVKPGYDFENNDLCLLWSGEKAYITTKDGKKVNAFDYYAMEYDQQETEYINGVHKDLVEWSNKNNISWEAYDAGTYLGYSSI
jgi:aerobic-type carbon monoxide dehydrogenase small subunit (CoxS/CutS family)